MNSYWEELIGKGEELFDARPQLRAHHTLQHLNSFLRLHVIKHVQSVIEAMSSSSASGCASAFVDQRNQALSDHSDLRDAVKAQVSVSHSSDSQW